ncbi:angiogenin-like [Carettochelys insculpta]|uniref:angiogenin-like n=1 Tax=Carettochelys insculpta TaxID=44489 RepID=UPI003EB6A900
MVWKGSYLVLLPSLILLASWLALALGQSTTMMNEQFLKQHWDNPKTPVILNINPPAIPPSTTTPPTPPSSPDRELQTRAREFQGGTTSSFMPPLHSSTVSAVTRGTMMQKQYPLWLLLLCLALASAETRYGKFVRQHIDYPKTSAPDSRTYCNQMMQHRKMTSPTCKFTNTFIHDSAKMITTVCGSGGTPAKGNLRDSKAAFPITTCQLQGGSQKPPCSYKAKSNTQRIRIACEGRFPVHYEPSK